MLAERIKYLIQSFQPQSFLSDSLQCGCVLVYRSEVVSPTRWAEKAEQKARERIQPLLDEAQVGKKCHVSSFLYVSCRQGETIKYILSV